jgi:hypothetical protein
MLWVDQPSKTSLSLSVFLTMADSGIATPEERLRPNADETKQPEVMN